MSRAGEAGSSRHRVAATRGQLRIYLGSAPGVGKTWALLSEGHRRTQRGADVVVACAETHGRPRTAALLEGLEIIPFAEVPYRGTFVAEMDLDAVLARRPEVALLDDLAHTNVPGSRHCCPRSGPDRGLSAGPPESTCTLSPTPRQPEVRNVGRELDRADRSLPPGAVGRSGDALARCGL